MRAIPINKCRNAINNIKNSLFYGVMIEQNVGIDQIRD